MEPCRYFGAVEQLARRNSKQLDSLITAAEVQP